MFLFYICQNKKRGLETKTKYAFPLAKLLSRYHAFIAPLPPPDNANTYSPHRKRLTKKPRIILTSTTFSGKWLVIKRRVALNLQTHFKSSSAACCCFQLKFEMKSCSQWLISPSKVRQTSHKPDEIYGVIERLAPGTRKIGKKVLIFIFKCCNVKGKSALLILF